MKIKITHLIIGLSLALFYSCSSTEAKEVKEEEKPVSLEEFISDRVWTNFGYNTYYLDSTKEYFSYTVHDYEYEKPIGTPVTNRVSKIEAKYKSGWIYGGDYKVSNDTLFLYEVFESVPTVNIWKVAIGEDVEIAGRMYNTKISADTSYSLAR